MATGRFFVGNCGFFGVAGLFCYAWGLSRPSVHLSVRSINFRKTCRRYRRPDRCRLRAAAFVRIRLFARSGPGSQPLLTRSFCRPSVHLSSDWFYKSSRLPCGTDRCRLRAAPLRCVFIFSPAEAADKKISLAPGCASPCSAFGSSLALLASSILNKKIHYNL